MDESIKIEDALTSKRAANALKRICNVITLDDAFNIGRDKLLSYKGISLSTICNINSALYRNGYNLEEFWSR